MSAAVAMPAPAEAPRLTLLQIDEEISCLLDSIECIPEDELGAIAEATEELQHLVALKLRKLDAIAHVRASFSFRIDLATAEIKRLQAFKAYCERQMERLDGSVIHAMQVTGQKKIVGDTNKVTLQTAVGKLDIVDADLIPAEYTTTTTVVETTTNTAEIKKALKAGEDVPGARLLDGKEYLKWS